MKQIAVFGASGFGREVMPLVRNQCANLSEEYSLVFVDDRPVLPEINGHRVLTYDQWIRLPATSRFITLAIADSKIRKQLESRCKVDGINFLEVRSSNVVQMDSAELGEGAILSPFVTLTSNIRIGKQFHANLYSYIAHDCVVGDFVTLAPGVMCNGNVVIEDHVYIGTGAIIRQGQPDSPLIVGQGAVIGMGAVVTKSVLPGVTIVGNPAKPLLKK